MPRSNSLVFVGRIQQRVLAAIDGQFTANLPLYAVMLRVAPEVLPRLRYAGHFARLEDQSTGCRGCSRFGLM